MQPNSNNTNAALFGPFVLPASPLLSGAELLIDAESGWARGVPITLGRQDAEEASRRSA